MYGAAPFPLLTCTSASQYFFARAESPRSSNTAESASLYGAYAGMPT